MRVALTVLLLAALAVASAETIQSLTNEQIERVIDIRAHIEEQTVKGRVKNTGKDSINYVLFALNAYESEHLSYLEVIFGDKDNGPRAELRKVQVDSSAALAGTQFWRADLPNALRAGDSIRFRAVSTYLHTLEPFPAKVAQDDPQLVTLKLKFACLLTTLFPFFAHCSG